MNPILIEARSITKRFSVYQRQKTLFRLTNAMIRGKPLTGKLVAVDNVSLTVRQGDKIGIIGENGAGKTTLLKLLAALFRPTGGTLDIHQYPRPFFSRGIGAMPDLPVIDNAFVVGAFMGMPVSYIESRLDAILSFSGLAPFAYVPFKRLSSGQKQRLLFSVFIQTTDPFLLMDEAISVADSAFHEKCVHAFYELLTPERTLLIATHDLSSLTSICSHVIWLHHGKVMANGQPEQVIEAYQESVRIS